MKIAIMQPYFLPYIGYWQLINAVDKFVVFDDVHFIKRGWINRNRILVQMQPQYITIPLAKASQNVLIKDISIVNSDWKTKMLKTIEINYKKAPEFTRVLPLIKNIVENQHDDLTVFLVKSIQSILRYIGIEKMLLRSSELNYDRRGNGSDKILSICNALGANSYYNLSGGHNLYNKTDFNERNLELRFIQSEQIEYIQFSNDFIENLSILDIMMFCDPEQINQFLSDYKLK